MAERNTQQAQQGRDEPPRIVGFSAADEIEKLDRLKKAGSITDPEFARLRAKLVQESLRLLTDLVGRGRPRPRTEEAGHKATAIGYSVRRGNLRKD